MSFDKASIISMRQEVERINNERLEKLAAEPTNSERDKAIQGRVDRAMQIIRQNTARKAKSRAERSARAEARQSLSDARSRARTAIARERQAELLRKGSTPYAAARATVPNRWSNNKAPTRAEVTERLRGGVSPAPKPAAPKPAAPALSGGMSMPRPAASRPSGPSMSVAPRTAAKPAASAAPKMQGAGSYAQLAKLVGGGATARGLAQRFGNRDIQRGAQFNIAGIRNALSGSGSFYGNKALSSGGFGRKGSALKRFGPPKAAPKAAPAVALSPASAGRGGLAPIRAAGPFRVKI